MIVTRAPGKLFIAGEYAVVEPGASAILVAVDRYLTVRLDESDDVGHIHSGEYGGAPLEWTRDADGIGVLPDHQPADYVLSAISVVERLRAERGHPPRYFDIHIASELNDARGTKFGLGSSAAVTVAVIEAMDTFYGLGLTRTERFKISLLATIQVSPEASGGDLAASTFGGWVRYTSPDRSTLRQHLDSGTVTAALASAGWGEYRIEHIAAPHGLRLLVGWTGLPASTERLVRNVQTQQPGDTDDHTAFLRASAATVSMLADALADGDALGSLRAVREARFLLQGLGERTGILIETPALAALCDAAERHGGAGKPSGAGGGDCGIAFVPDDTPLHRVLAEWEHHDIQRLELSVHPPQSRNDEQRDGAGHDAAVHPPQGRNDDGR